MLLVGKTPKLFHFLFPSLVWKKNTSKKKIWLTFDDGPTPEITSFVLDVLHTFNAKATFFCLGKQIKKYPEVINRIKKDGHYIGNHSYSHQNGYTTCKKKYLADVESCKKFIPESSIFRPPFGNLYPWQISKLKKQYKIIMWDVMSKDFDNRTNEEDCYYNVVNNVEPGSIVLFHDNKKSFKNLKSALPRILKKLKIDGYSFSTTW